jgi:hypothetical protein
VGDAVVAVSVDSSHRGSTDDQAAGLVVLDVESGAVR